MNWFFYNFYGQFGLSLIYYEKFMKIPLYCLVNSFLRVLHDIYVFWIFHTAHICSPIYISVWWRSKMLVILWIPGVLEENNFNIVCASCILPFSSSLEAISCTKYRSQRSSGSIIGGLNTRIRNPCIESVPINFFVSNIYKNTYHLVRKIKY